MPRRNAKGRFVKGGGGGTKRKASTAIVRTSSKPIIIRQGGGGAVTHKRKGRGRRRHFGGGGGHTPLKTKGEIALWGSLLGYFSEEKAATYNQIPTVGKLPREAVIGGVLHLFGGKHKHVDRAATAALAVAGFKLGQQKFALSGWGDDD